MEINFEPTPPQYEVWKYLFDKTTTMILAGGSVRSGKSYLAVAFAILYSLAYPNIQGAIARSRLSSLKRTTLVTFFEALKNFGLVEDEHYTFNRSELILTFNNGSKIFFIELYDNPSDPYFERIMSMSLTFAIIDEASQISANAIGKLVTRLSHLLIEYNLVPKLLIVTNPTQGYIYDEFYKPYIENRLESHKKVILSLPQQNPYVSESYINNLETILDPVTKQRLLYGNWEVDEDDYSIFKYDDILQMFYNDVVGGEKYISVDVANIGTDKTVIGIWNGLECFKIFKYEKKDTTQVVQLIKEKMKIYKVPIKNVVIDADGLGIGVADYLKGCVAFKGGSSALNKENYKNLRSQCYMKLSNIISDVKVDEQFKDYIIKDLQAHKLNDPDADGKTSIISKDKIKQMIGKSPDFSDMLMMRMYFEIKKKKIKTYVY